ncbi:acetylxylan esterase [Thermodesulfobacteriota bacterium]
MRIPKACCLACLLAIVVVAVLSGCESEPDQRLEPEAFPSAWDLPPLCEPPDPFALFRTGERIETPQEWRDLRRPEIMALFEHYVYGAAPGRPAGMEWTIWDEEPAALGGIAVRKQVEIQLGGERAPTMHLLLYVPNDVDSPVPVFLGLNFYGNHTVIDDPAVPLSDQWVPNRGEGVVDNHATEASRGTAIDRWSIEQTLGRGYAVATVYHGDIDPDFNDFSNGIHPLYYEPGHDRPGPSEWGTIASWAWGLNRAMDYLATEPLVEAGRVAVMGHSRNGKAALLAGATDERIAAVISNQSGCVGAALSRRRKGETLFWINLVYPHWFCGNFKSFMAREKHLPLDQHLLIALVAPRPVLVLSGLDDWWSDPEGEFLGTRGAGPVYQLLGAGGLEADWMPALGEIAGGPLAYHIREGGHAIGSADWAVFADFADEYL